MPEPAPSGATYDADAVARRAMSKDPGLPEQLALRLARRAEVELRSMETPDAPELSRRLLASEPKVGATPTNLVASAAVEYCQANGLTF